VAKLFFSILPLVILLGSGCGSHDSIHLAVGAREAAVEEPVYSGALTETQAKIVAAAKDQLSWGTVYNSAYVSIPFPRGDVPRKQGVCTDVVVRSLRAVGHDLQELIHKDMKLAWSAYPRYSGLAKPDPNIDHRRVPNQIRYFERHAQKLTTAVSPRTLPEWQPGDIVYWKLESGLDHTGVLSDTVNDRGEPYVIHNLGGVREEDVLTRWKIVGLYRYPPAR
jgi:uncharacterized protein